MSRVLTEQLSALYRELVDGAPFSTATNVDLSDAPARGRCRQLLIVERLEDHSIAQTWSVVDQDGLHFGVPCPWAETQSFTEEYASTNPYITFSTRQGRIRFRLLLGAHWTRMRIGPLRSDGTFDPDHLVEMTPALMREHHAP